MSLVNPGLLLMSSAIAYLAGSVLYGAGTVSAAGDARRSMLRSGLVFAVFGVILHTAAIGARCAATHLMPFVTAPDMLSAVGWAIAIAFLVLQLCPVRERLVAIGAVAMPLAFLSVFAGSTIQSSHPVGSMAGRGLNNSLISLHVLAIVFAFGLLALAVGCALLYIFEDRMLKRKQTAQLLFWKLPPLITIDGLAFTLVSLAFPLLTVGILAGIIRAMVVGRHWSLEPHTLASTITWAIYGVYLWLHAGYSWRGPRANSLLLVGLAAALITYFAPSSLHQFS